LSGIKRYVALARGTSLRVWERFTVRTNRRKTGLSRLVLWPSSRLTQAEQEALERTLQANPLLARGYRLNARFQTLFAEQDPAAFAQWLKEGETSDLPPFQTVARSFRQDYVAIAWR
jgi:transposase